MRGTLELHCKICRKSSGRFPEMIFRQSGAGVGAQALSFEVWWCVPCWSGGREPWQVGPVPKLATKMGFSMPSCIPSFMEVLYLSVVEPPAVTGYITSLGILSFEVNDMEWCFGFSASKSLGMKELPSLPSSARALSPRQLLEFIRLCFP